MRFWLTTIIGDVILFMILVCLLPLLLYHPFPPPPPPFFFSFFSFFFLVEFGNWFIVHVTGAFNTNVFAVLGQGQGHQGHTAADHSAVLQLAPGQSHGHQSQRPLVLSVVTETMDHHRDVTCEFPHLVHTEPLYRIR